MTKTGFTGTDLSEHSVVRKYRTAADKRKFSICEGKGMERTERVILTNLCMIYDGSKVLVEEKIGKGANGIIFPGGHV